MALTMDWKKYQSICFLAIRRKCMTFQGKPQNSSPLSPVPTVWKKLLSNSAIIDEHYNTKAALNNAIVTDIYHIIILHLCHAIMLMLI